MCFGICESSFVFTSSIELICNLISLFSVDPFPHAERETISMRETETNTEIDVN